MGTNIVIPNSSISSINTRDNISTLAWAPLTLYSNWSNFGNGYPYASIRKHATGAIELKGLIKKTTSTVVNEGIAALPISCTPYENRLFPSVTTIDTSSFQLGTFGVNSNNSIIYIGGSTGFFSLQASWQSEKQTALFFGDSITAGYGLNSTTQRWSFLVSSNLTYTEDNQGIPSSPLQNSGASGSSNSGIINNGFDTYQSRVINQFPDKVFIAYGTNDMFDTLSGVSLDVFKAQYQTVLNDIFKANIRARDIVLVCPPYVSPALIYGNPAYNCNLNKHLSHIQAVKDLAHSNKVLYADSYTPMLNGGGDSLLQSDGVHPNANGHAIIANAVLNAIYI